MTLAARNVTTSVPSTEELRGFYDDYMEVLDDGRLEEWSEFFVDDCLYQIIPRENYENNYSLCTIQADSKGMVIDRVQGIIKTQMFAPRYYRRFYSGLRVKGSNEHGIRVRQNVLMIQTLIDQPSQIVLCGISHDLLVRSAEALRFKERILVTDSEMIPNSLIYPA